MTRLSMLVLLALAAACGGGSEPPPEPGPYRVVIDVAPQVRAFGEDTASADEAVDQLVHLGPPVVPAMATVLAREPRDGRQKAIEVLLQIADPTCLPPLVQAARSDEDEDVRADALRALGALGDPRATPVLEEMLADPRETVRVGAIMGCGALCTSPSALERLAAIALDATQPALALAARTTLGQLRAGGADVSGAVEKAVAYDGGSPDRKALAALVAADADAAAAMPTMIAALPGASPALQRQLVWRLAAVGDETTVSPLAALFGSGDLTLRLYVCDALARLRDRGVVTAGAALDGYGGRKPMAPLGPPEF
jgi:HEAT repeat protein